MIMYRRGKPFNKGRWQTQRERLHLSQLRPPDPFVVHTAKDVLDQLLDGVTVNAEERSMIDDMVFQWPKLFGQDIANHSRPGSLAQGQLVVYAAHSIWVAELSRQRGLMLKKIKDRFPQHRIRQLVIRLDPDMS